MAGKTDRQATDGLAPAVQRGTSTPFEPLPAPELVFAVTGAIGTDLSLVCDVLKEILREVRYDEAEIIRLSDLLRTIEGMKEFRATPWMSAPSN